MPKIKEKGKDTWEEVVQLKNQFIYREICDVVVRAFEDAKNKERGVTPSKDIHKSEVAENVFNNLVSCSVVKDTIEDKEKYFKIIEGNPKKLTEQLRNKVLEIENVLTMHSDKIKNEDIEKMNSIKAMLINCCEKLSVNQKRENARR